MVNREWSLEQLRAKAEAYCAAAEHCCYDMHLKLQQWGATAEQAEQIVSAKVLRLKHDWCVWLARKAFYTL